MKEDRLEIKTKVIGDCLVGYVVHQSEGLLDPHRSGSLVAVGSANKHIRSVRSVAYPELAYNDLALGAYTLYIRGTKKCNDGAIFHKSFSSRSEAADAECEVKALVAYINSPGWSPGGDMDELPKLAPGSSCTLPSSLQIKGRPVLCLRILESREGNLYLVELEEEK